MSKINGVELHETSFPSFMERFGEKELEDLKTQFNKAASGDIEAIFNVANDALLSMAINRSRRSDDDLEEWSYTDNDIKTRDNVLKLAEHLIKEENSEKAKLFFSNLMLGAVATRLSIKDKTNERCLIEADMAIRELLRSSSDSMRFSAEGIKETVKLQVESLEKSKKKKNYKGLIIT